MDSKFDNIRPYDDKETVAALRRLSAHPILDKIQKFTFPEKEDGWLSALLQNITDVDDFQNRVMFPTVASIIAQTTDGLSVGGLENFILSDGTVGRFLLLSTHRDIVLDPAFIQYALHKNGLPYTEIAVGDNLMVNPAVEDMIRSNRMIKVVRSSNPREVYTTSSILSKYIRNKVCTGSGSIWLAHRQGRTKDGYDATEQGLLKMIDMAGEGSFLENFCKLPIMPVTVSYEYESCGALKSLELYTKQLNGEYHKKEGEDLNSMIKGIIQYKGRVHIEFCKPLQINELEKADRMTKNDKFRKLAEIVDQRLIPAFKLWPANYAAADLIEGGDRFMSLYSEKDKAALLNHIDEECKGLPEEVKNRLLQIYSAHILKKV